MLLYKYVTPARIDVLENLRIRFTQPNACNDPFEFRPLVEGLQSRETTEAAFNDHLKSELGARLRELPQHVQHLAAQLEDEVGLLTAGLQQHVNLGVMMFEAASKRVLEMLQDGMGAYIGILSLTENPTDNVMWAHYGANHEGFVLVFHSEHSCFHARRSDTDEFCELQPVRYLDTPSSAYLIDLTGAEIFYAKRNEWGYEREWRIIRPLEQAAQRVGNDIHLFDVPADAIRGVIFGLRSNSGLRGAIRKTIRESTQLAHVVLAEIRRGPLGLAVTGRF
jgi:hypothetical protein